MRYFNAVRLFLTCIFGILLCLPAVGEEIVAQVQKELRARKFYFGEINGRASEETVAAIEKFQLARGIDRTGNLDGETLRALGLPPGEQAKEGEAGLLKECCDFVLHYYRARESGDWSRVAVFYADEMDYLEDESVKQEALRKIHAADDQRTPGRKYTLLNRIASILPGRPDTAQITARVRTEYKGKSDAAEGLTEDLLFRVRKTDTGWRIISLKLLE